MININIKMENQNNIVDYRLLTDLNYCQKFDSSDPQIRPYQFGQ